MFSLLGYCVRCNLRLMDKSEGEMYRGELFCYWCHPLVGYDLMDGVGVKQPKKSILCRLLSLIDDVVGYMFSHRKR